MNRKILGFSILEIILVLFMLFIRINRKCISPLLVDVLIIFLGIGMVVALIVFIVTIINEHRHISK